MAKTAAAVASSKSHERMKRAAALVDELGPIEKEIAAEYATVAIALGTKPERAAALCAEILALYENAQAEIPFVAEGEKFVAMLTARTNQTEVTSMAKVQNFLGRENFLKLASIGLGVLRKHLDPTQLASCTKTQRTGERTLTVVERGA